MPAQPVGVIGASMGGSVAVEMARRQPQRIDALLLLAPPVSPGARCRFRPFWIDWGPGSWHDRSPQGLCRQAFADPDADVGAPEEQIASLHLQCPGWADALAAARSGAGCGTPLPQQPLHVIWEPMTAFCEHRRNKLLQQFSRMASKNSTLRAPHRPTQRVADRCLNWFQAIASAA